MYPLMAAPRGNEAIAMAAAPLANSTAVAPAPAAVADGNGKMPLPTGVFSLVNNPKSYPDRSDASKSTSKIAHVDITTGVVTFQASIYLETKVVQTEAGRSEQKAVRFSMPKGVSIRDVIPAERVAEWKDSTIDAYLTWASKNGGAGAAGVKPSAGVRTLPEPAKSAAA